MWYDFFVWNRTCISWFGSFDICTLYHYYRNWNSTPALLFWDERTAEYVTSTIRSERAWRDFNQPTITTANLLDLIR